MQVLRLRFPFARLRVRFAQDDRLFVGAIAGVGIAKLDAVGVDSALRKTREIARRIALDGRGSSGL